MKKVNVNGKIGFTTSVIPHSNNKYPVWFSGLKCPKFIESGNVKFVK